MADTPQIAEGLATLYVFNISGWTLIPSNQDIIDNGNPLASLPRLTYTDWAVARGNLGYGLAQAGRVDEAITEYRAALALDPGDTRTRYNLGDALIRTSRSDDAVSEARVLVTREPTSTLAWQRLVAAFMVGRRYSDAWAEVQRAAAAGVVVPAAIQNELPRKLGSPPAR